MHFLFPTLFISSILISGISAYIPHLLHPDTEALVNLSKYDIAVRPPGVDNQDDPVNVSITFFLRSVEKVDHSRNEYKVQITFREEWTDKRLSYNGYDRDVSTTEVDRFWKPDVFFSNERTGHTHTITVPNSFVRLRPSGHILLSSRISLTLICNMNLWNFPFDSQFCELRLPSYGYTTDDVILQWKHDQSSVEVPENIPIPGYTLVTTDVDTCTSRTSTGEYSCLKAVFWFKRDTFPYIIRLYIPITILVMASWTSFWLPASASVHRLTIGSITSLTTALLIFREEEFLRLPSLTALDVWVGVSALMVFSALFEYILITYLSGKKAQTRDLDAEAAEPKKGVKILWFIDAPRDVPLADSVSKFAYPATYALFHVIFGPQLF